jgi:predicted glutamine amidotransferase
MCLIIHKPAGVAIPDALFTAAASLNSDGWGLVAFRQDGGTLVERFATVDVEAALTMLRGLVDDELALHLRRATRGGFDLENAQPLRVDPRWLLMHNGNLPTRMRVPGRSDSWHLARDLLQPLLSRDPELPHEDAFAQFLSLGVRRQNKLVLADQQTRRFVIINREHGADVDGLWLSNTRWIDSRHLVLSKPVQPQKRSYAAQALHFI